jgi:ABC-2 type transport system ATP-binding protein
MIRIENVSLSYGKQVVIRDLFLEIPETSVHGLVGLNGSGKTTLIKALYRMKTLDRGKLSFRDEPLQRKDIAYLETDPFFYSNITGREYLRLFSLKNKAFDLEGWNNLFELSLDRFIEEYSTGMKKKLAFMGIIALNRTIMILDEPFNGIDLETTQKLKIIIKALREKGKTILLTSHILESLTSICDAISYLQDQKISYTFERAEFAGMEDKIFKNFNAENEGIVRRLME